MRLRASRPRPRPSRSRSRRATRSSVAPTSTPSRGVVIAGDDGETALGHIESRTAHPANVLAAAAIATAAGADPAAIESGIDGTTSAALAWASRWARWRASPSSTTAWPRLRSKTAALLARLSRSQHRPDRRRPERRRRRVGPRRTRGAGAPRARLRRDRTRGPGLRRVRGRRASARPPTSGRETSRRSSPPTSRAPSRRPRAMPPARRRSSSPRSSRSHSTTARRFATLVDDAAK